MIIHFVDCLARTEVGDLVDCLARTEVVHLVDCIEGTEDGNLVDCSAVDLVCHSIEIQCDESVPATTNYC